MTELFLWIGSIAVSYLAGWGTGPYLWNKFKAWKDRVMS